MRRGSHEATEDETMKMNSLLGGGYGSGSSDDGGADGSDEDDGGGLFGWQQSDGSEHSEDKNDDDNDDDDQAECGIGRKRKREARLASLKKRRVSWADESDLRKILEIERVDVISARFDGDCDDKEASTQAVGESIDIKHKPYGLYPPDSQQQREIPILPDGSGDSGGETGNSMKDAATDTDMAAGRRREDVEEAFFNFEGITTSKFQNVKSDYREKLISSPPNPSFSYPPPPPINLASNLPPLSDSATAINIEALATLARPTADTTLAFLPDPQPVPAPQPEVALEWFCDGCDDVILADHERWECTQCPDEFCLCATCKANGHPHPLFLSSAALHITKLVG